MSIGSVSIGNIHAKDASVLQIDKELNIVWSLCSGA